MSPLFVRHVVPAVVLVAALTGCGGGDAPQAQPPPEQPSQGTAGIVIENFTFSPSSLQVRVGQDVAVVNKDRATHTLTSTDGKFDTGDLRQGETKTFRISEPGTYSYICDLHQYMKGTVIAS